MDLTTQFTTNCFKCGGRGFSWGNYRDFCSRDDCSGHTSDKTICKACSGVGKVPVPTDKAIESLQREQIQLQDEILKLKESIKPKTKRLKEVQRMLKGALG